MQNPLVGLVKKVSKMEELGIYIENIDLSDRFKLMDDNPMTLTGIPRPAGEYYQAQLLVLVAVEQSKDDGNTFVEPKSYPTFQGIYAPLDSGQIYPDKLASQVQDAIPACKHKRFKRLNVADPIIRGDIIFTEPNHGNKICKKAEPSPAADSSKLKTANKKKKYPDDIDKIIARDPAHGEHIQKSIIKRKAK